MRLFDEDFDRSNWLLDWLMLLVFLPARHGRLQLRYTVLEAKHEWRWNHLCGAERTEGNHTTEAIVTSYSVPFFLLHLICVRRPRVPPRGLWAAGRAGAARRPGAGRRWRAAPRRPAGTRPASRKKKNSTYIHIES